MAKCKVNMTKKGAPGAMKAPLKAAAAGPLQAEVDIQDNGDQTFTVFGKDKAGNQVALDGLADISVVSVTPATLTADIPTTPPSTFAVHAVGPITPAGSPVVVTVTATWKDGSVGPFSIDIPFATKAGPATTIVAVPAGPPTSH